MRGTVEVEQRRLEVQYTLTGDKGVMTGDAKTIADLMGYDGQSAILHLADGSSIPIDLYGGKVTATTYGSGGHVDFRRRSV